MVHRWYRIWAFVDGRLQPITERFASRQAAGSWLAKLMWPGDVEIRGEVDGGV